MISKDEFRQSPKFTMLKAKIKAVLDTDPDYIKAASELEATARDMYKELEKRAMEDASDAADEDRIADALDDYKEAEELKKNEAFETMSRAGANEIEAELEMRRIQKRSFSISSAILKMLKPYITIITTKNPLIQTSNILKIKQKDK